MSTAFSVLNLLATIIVGCIGLGTYFLRRKQDRQMAARAVLTEIQNAELAIDEVRRLQIVGPLSSVLRTDSWAEYSLLLLSEFDFMEQRSIAQFYNACKSIQKNVEYLQGERIEQLQAGGIELQKKIVELCLCTENKEHLNQKISLMTNRYHEQEYWFTQNPCKKSLIESLEKMERLTNTPVMEKLKRIAGIY